MRYPVDVTDNQGNQSRASQNVNIVISEQQEQGQQEQGQQEQGQQEQGQQEQEDDSSPWGAEF